MKRSAYFVSRTIFEIFFELFEVNFEKKASLILRAHNLLEFDEKVVYLGKTNRRRVIRTHLQDIDVVSDNNFLPVIDLPILVCVPLSVGCHCLVTVVTLLVRNLCTDRKVHS